MKQKYGAPQRCKAFVRGLGRFHPLLEVARDAFSGRYSLTPEQESRYSDRILGSYARRISSKEYAGISRMVDDFHSLPAPVKTAAFERLLTYKSVLRSMEMMAWPVERCEIQRLRARIDGLRTTDL